MTPTPIPPTPAPTPTPTPGPTLSSATAEKYFHPLAGYELVIPPPEVGTQLQELVSAPELTSIATGVALRLVTRNGDSANMAVLSLSLLPSYAALPAVLDEFAAGTRRPGRALRARRPPSAVLRDDAEEPCVGPPHVHRRRLRQRSRGDDPARRSAHRIEPVALVAPNIRRPSVGASFAKQTTLKAPSPFGSSSASIAERLLAVRSCSIGVGGRAVASRIPSASNISRCVPDPAKRKPAPSAARRIAVKSTLAVRS